MCVIPRSESNGIWQVLFKCSSKCDVVIEVYPTTTWLLTSFPLHKATAILSLIRFLLGRIDAIEDSEGDDVKAFFRISLSFTLTLSLRCDEAVGMR